MLIRKEIRDMIEFVINEVDDWIVGREGQMINSILEDGTCVNELIETYRVLKDEYGSMYSERNLLYIDKLEYSKKMVTLLAYKAKELKATEDKDGAYTIATKIKIKDDGLKPSLISE